MHFPSLFIGLVYSSAYLSLLFAAVCLACGLYYLVELAEEYTVLTKKIIRVTILVHIVIHILLFVYERFPFFQCIVGLAAHLMYLQLLRPFPFINPMSSPFLISVLLFIVDNVVWFRYLWGDIEVFYRYRVAPVPATAGFYFLVIWLVPCAFFCSLTVNDSVLPASNNSAFSGNPSQAAKQQRRNVVMLGLEKVAASVRKLLGNKPRRRDIFSSDSSLR